MAEPQIHFFDMDYTLQDNDSDVSWKLFLIKEGLAPANAMELADLYFEQYKQGTLQLEEFFRFQLAEFIGKTPAQMKPLLQQHFNEYCLPKIFPAARELVNTTRKTGAKIVILTSTNRYIAAPMGRELGFDDVLACDLELQDGKFTGRLASEYSGGPGKVNYATDYCRRHGLALNRAAYYGDGISDRFILEQAGFPVAVNPVSELRQLAILHHWQIIDFKK